MDFEKHFISFFFPPQVFPVGGQEHPSLLKGASRAAYFFFHCYHHLIDVAQNCLVSHEFNNTCRKTLQLHLQWSTGGKVTRATERESAAVCFEKRSQEKLTPKEFITVVSGLSWDSVKSNIKEIWRNLSWMFSNTQIDIRCKICERHILRWSTQTGVLSHT